MTTVDPRAGEAQFASATDPEHQPVAAHRQLTEDAVKAAEVKKAKKAAKKTAAAQATDGDAADTVAVPTAPTPSQADDAAFPVTVK